MVINFVKYVKSDLKFLFSDFNKFWMTSNKIVNTFVLFFYFSIISLFVTQLYLIKYPKGMETYICFVLSQKNLFSFLSPYKPILS